MPLFPLSAGRSDDVSPKLGALELSLWDGSLSQKIL
jgi:hypothetical protein